MEKSAFAKTMARTVSALHTNVYRWFGGAGPFNRHTLILTTRGRKTGRDVSTPLLYVSAGGRYYIVASFGGSDQPPAWYLNLVKSPEVTIEVRRSRTRCRARSLTPEDATLIWPKLLAIWPAYATYQKRTPRIIPVVELMPTEG